MKPVISISKNSILIRMSDGSFNAITELTNEEMQAIIEWWIGRKYE